MTIQAALARVIQRNHLSRDEAAEIMRVLMSGEATAAQTGALLAALRTKGETVEELTGFTAAMRALATPIVTQRRPLVDTCGTGGDHAGTFNISTTAAFVVAGAGVAVAKHGNRSASSLCGSADVLEALGVNINASPLIVGKCIDAIGIGFLFSRTLHNAMKYVAAARAELGVRTVFNLLGPMTNPADADGQMMGIFDRAYQEPVARVLIELGARHVFVVAADDGLDELSLSGPSRIVEATRAGVNDYEIVPEQFGLNRAPREALIGGDAAVNAVFLRDVLAGKPGPCRDVVLLNAAPAIVAGQGADTLTEAFARAVESIDSGAALEKLEALVRLSHDS